MTLPTEQVATPGTFATGLFPSIGRSQGLVMGFYNVCGGWRFSVTKEGIRKVTLKSNGGEYIAGKVKVGLNESGIPVIQEIINGSDEVILECPRGEYFEVGQNYYMILLPTVFESGFTMTFETYTEEGSYNRTARTTVRRSGFSGIANLDSYLTTPYTQKTGNIPVEDANFKAYLVANFDTDSDGEISFAEAAAITSIETCTDEILSVQGVEYMPDLASLSVRGSGAEYVNNQRQSKGQLTSLDVSNNPALTHLSCNYNQLTTLDVSNNTLLTDLYCIHNQLTTLDVSNNTALTRLFCSDNQLTTLDVSNNTVLTDLGCDDNQLTTLDISNNTALTSLGCYNNQLSTLDVSNNTALTRLFCSDNQLTTLDVSSNTSLIELSCYDNQISTLNLANNAALDYLYCSDNQLTTLDISNNTALTYLSCEYNQLTTLDVSHNTALTFLNCSYNHLSTLDVSYNTALTRLYCYRNHLNSLDVSNNTALTFLNCSNNQLSTLDVSNNTALEILYCSNNQLSTLDVSRNLSLTALVCAPMESLETLKIAQGQEIPNITTNRNDNCIPAGTQIVVAPTSGGSEGTGDEELNP